jgi:hypothetical protein
LLLLPPAARTHVARVLHAAVAGGDDR